MVTLDIALNADSQANCLEPILLAKVKEWAAASNVAFLSLRWKVLRFGLSGVAQCTSCCMSICLSLI